MVKDTLKIMDAFVKNPNSQSPSLVKVQPKSLGISPQDFAFEASQFE